MLAHSHIFHFQNYGSVHNANLDTVVLASKKLHSLALLSTVSMVLIFWNTRATYMYMYMLSSTSHPPSGFKSGWPALKPSGRF